MRGFLPQLGNTLRLHFRNKMALLYSYLFPTIFTIAFWVLYRYDQVPLVRHMGELLTVSVLGGACFGLPTTMVSERERGVWRRYRLAPVSTGTLVASTVIARYLLLVIAGVLQVALAMGLGMPLPKHPIDLWVAFTLVAFAFLGLGLVIAMLADNVPAVQALGQCIFLPMLIIGGVAVQLTSLPPWAQHVAAFFPGRYAVEAIQSTVSGVGLGATGFALLALVLIGGAGSLAGAKMFRWDAQQRFATRAGKGWLVVALGAWVAVGVMAEMRGRVGTPAASTSASAGIPAGSEVTRPAAVRTPATPPADGPSPPISTMTRREPPTGASQPAPNPPAAGAPPSSTTPASGPPPAGPPAPAAGAPASPSGPASWKEFTVAYIVGEIDVTRVPPDSGVVTPIAADDEMPDDDTAAEIEDMRAALPDWKPGKVEDPVQRVRNLLYVAATPDIFQMPMERFVAAVVYERLQADIPKDDLIKILAWIALHPEGGTDSAVDELRPLGLGNGPGDVGELRNRTAIYGVKLLGRLLGKLK